MDEPEIQVYDSITQSNKTLKKKSLNWYTCGPTVYDDAHIGHARTYVLLDVARRIAEHKGFDVQFAMNITDVDDKIIKSNVDPKVYEEKFWDNMKTLNVRLPTHVTRVTEFIPQIISYIQKIIENGYAYTLSDGVYFDTQHYKMNGFKYDIFRTESLCDIEDANQHKRHVHDFALWKLTTNGIHWSSPWGNGRPGWHIECSVMALEVFRHEDIDIHSGGIDLCFPHHQNEVAQVNAYRNDVVHNWVEAFMHTGHLHIDGRKMSKSLKNFITIDNLLKELTPRQVRLLFLMKHYRQNMTFTTDIYKEIIKLDHKIAEFVVTSPSDGDCDILQKSTEYERYLSNDFQANLVINDMQKMTNTIPTRQTQELVIKYMNILGLDYTLHENPSMDKLMQSRLIIKMLAKELKNPKLFKLVDDLRSIAQDDYGITIIDTKDASIRLS
jgi:cysteinyl-tRNA synthetase